MSQELKKLLMNPRFVAIVGMLGSDGPGERANAAALAGKMLKEAGGTWADVLAGAGPPARRESNVRVAALENQLELAHRALEIVKSDLQQRNQTIAHLRKENTKLTEQHADTVHQLRALKKTIEELQKLRAGPDKPAETKPGWGFQDIPPWEEDTRAGRVEPAPEKEFPIRFREIRPWLETLAANFWEDLSEWEIGYFQDFMTNKKAIFTAKQYAIFERTAAKVGLPLAF